MPRPTLDLDQFKEEIWHWVYSENCSSSVIARYVSGRLGKHVGARTIQSRLKLWKYNRRNMVEETTELRLSIAILFQKSYSDGHIVRNLHRSHNILISQRQVANIRKRLGLVRRMTVYQRAEADLQLVELVKQELDKGTIEGYGKRLLEKWFRKQGYVTTR